ncbi:MFS-type transporter [Bacillus subtilis]|uniref:MFS transporter n=1 Tax=Bacillus TaxID=1386 RepID=UPI0003A9DD88|nr:MULTISPECIES: MFS transporter [Bacillus]AOY06697.1 MFS transporter [Bacillus subtilis]KAF1341566.1 putative MFS-type transporter YitG [Bacillus subtilis]MBA5714996.1 MFS transporter [Bacillus subtilis]MDO3653315.1 MFS transporter [Bacillus subtilis]MEC3650714.1 MFS transporter [Bacillus subtilis]
MESSKQNNGMTVVAIGSIPLILTLGNSMLIPILPKMKSELHLSQFQVSLVITVFSLIAAFAIPIVGYLADRFSRKVIIIPCLILYGAGGLLAGFAAGFFDNAYPWVMAGRALQGIGAAGTGPIAMALTGDLFKGAQESKVLGLVEASNGMGKVLSPIIGSLIALLVWYGAFFAFPVFCIISIVLTWIFIKEKKKEKEPPPIGKYAKGLLSVFKHEGRWLFTAYLAGATCLFTLFGILFYLSDVLEKTYDTDGVKKGLILAIPLLVMCVTSYTTGSKIGQKQSLMKKLIVLGLAFMTVSYAALSFIENLVLFISVLVLSSIGSGLVLPCVNSFITGAVGKERRGFVTSLYGSVRFLGVAIGPPIFGRLMQWSRPGMFLSIAGLTLVVGILVMMLIHVKQNNEDTKEKEDPKMAGNRLQPAEER